MKKPPPKKSMPKHKPAMPMPKKGMAVKGGSKRGKPDRDYADS